MATRQYIGARYVTKIYVNSVDPSSAEWEASTNYDPLTMVTYNNGSYLSRKEVTATVGNPAANPQYWAQTGFYNGQIAQLQNDVQSLQTNVANIKSLFVDVRAYGAKLDGVTDDSDAFNAALQEGSILLPENATFYIASTVNIPSNRIIDFNWSTMTAQNGITAFKLNDSDATEPVLYVTIKNIFVDGENGFTAFAVHNSYNVEFDNIRIVKIQPNYKGIDVTNVFNVVFKRCWIQGDSANSYAANTDGISVATDTGNLPNLQNITNIAFYDCLLQRLDNGLHIHRKTSVGNFEDIIIINHGSSQSNVCINIDTHQARAVVINDLRCETSNIGIRNMSDYVKINSVNGFSMEYIIENEGELTLGNTYINNTNLDHTGYTLKSNTGRIRLIGNRNSGISISEIDDYTNIGKIIDVPAWDFQNISGGTTFSPTAFLKRRYNFTGSNNITNCDNVFDGVEFDFIVSAGTLTIGSNTYTADNSYHTAKYINSDWYVI